jgi:hypothetical protein
VEVVLEEINKFLAMKNTEAEVVDPNDAPSKRRAR